MVRVLPDRIRQGRRPRKRSWPFLSSRCSMKVGPRHETRAEQPRPARSNELLTTNILKHRAWLPFASVHLQVPGIVVGVEPPWRARKDPSWEDDVAHVRVPFPGRRVQCQPQLVILRVPYSQLPKLVFIGKAHTASHKCGSSCHKSLSRN